MMKIPGRGAMSTSARASAAGLRTLAGIVSQDRPDVPASGGLPPSLLDDLAGQIRCDALHFFGMDSGRRAYWFAQAIPPIDTTGSEDLDRAQWEHYWDCKPCSYPDRSGDLRSISKISDFYSARQWHATGMYHDLYRPTGIEHYIYLCLPEASGQTPEPGRTVRLVLSRGPGPDFSERDRALLTLLRPHLHQAYRDAERRRQVTPELTRRQWELLRLVAVGHTNGQIARRLGVSEGTVRIHLQNIYGRLQVSSRTAAVTRAFPTLQPGSG
jgi:DNA-binding CsgD family transcriptional regulator